MGTQTANVVRRACCPTPVHATRWVHRFSFTHYHFFLRPPRVASRVEDSLAAPAQHALGSRDSETSAREQATATISEMANHAPLFELGSRVTVNGCNGTVFSGTVAGYPAVGFNAAVFVDDGVSTVRTTSLCSNYPVISFAPTMRAGVSAAV